MALRRCCILALSMKSSGLRWPASQKAIRPYSSRFARKAVKVYMPGEKVPKSKEEERALQKSEEEAETKRNYGLPRTDTFVDVMAKATKTRDKKNIVLEGERVIEEGFMNGLIVRYLYMQDTLKEVPARLKNYVEASEIQVEMVSPKLMKKWSDLVTPPGIIGIFKKPTRTSIQERAQTVLPFSLICDNLREPGNLGAIIRSAAGSGCSQVLLTKGCVDPWEGKVLRSGCGAHFKIPIETGVEFHKLPNFILQDVIESGVSTTTSGDLEITSPESVRFRPSGRSIPPFAWLIADNSATENASIPLVNYTDVNYKDFEYIYLVLGGETEGLSSKIWELSSNLRDTHPQFQAAHVARVRVPMNHGMDSLNSAHTFSIIAYEVLRQLTKKDNPSQDKEDSKRCSDSVYGRPRGRVYADRRRFDAHHDDRRRSETRYDDRIHSESNYDDNRFEESYGDQRSEANYDDRRSEANYDNRRSDGNDDHRRHRKTPNDYR